MNNKKLISGSHDKKIKVWDVISGKNMNDLIGHNYEICKVILSADGERLLSWSEYELKIWRLDNMVSR